MITLEEVSFSYHPGSDEEQRALEAIRLVVHRGEFVALVGANGSGKSTLAKHLNALLRPTSGRVTVAGYDSAIPDHLWEIRRRVGMVFQNPDNQLVATTVEEDIAFGPENLGVAREEIHRRVDQALRAVRMDAYRLRSPHHLSGGQKQRVAVAGILAMRPEVIVLDEPTSMLDPLGRSEVLDTVRDLHRRHGLTLVYVTHFMEEAALADRLVVLERGRIVADGPPREVFARCDLERVGLEWPAAESLARRLRACGVKLPDEIHSGEGLVEALCRLPWKT